MGSLLENLEQIRRRIAEAAVRGGRDPAAIELMAVTKTLDRSAVEEAADAGIKLFGENRVQEAMAKYEDERPGISLHLIGHLQRNKARHVPGLFACVESIDRVETAAALDKRCSAEGRTIDILLEYNTSGESSKSGFSSLEDLEAAIVGLRPLTSLRLRGLMTIAPFTDDRDKIRTSFRKLRHLFDRTMGLVDDSDYDTLSMGMSSDYEIAIEEGSTRVRVGTALFGRRP